MQYLTYAEYQGYGGTVDQTAFDNLEFKARKRIDHLTDCRVRDHMAVISEAVKRCMLSLIEMENAVGIETQASTPVKASFSTDGYSESYANVITSETSGARMDTLATTMLYGELDDEGVPLLYLGVRG